MSGAAGQCPELGCAHSILSGHRWKSESRESTGTLSVALPKPPSRHFHLAGLRLAQIHGAGRPPRRAPLSSSTAPCHRSPSFLTQDSTAAPTTPGEQAKPQEEGGIASTHSGVLLFSDLKTLFLLLGQHPVWKAGCSRPSVLLSAVSCLTPRRSTPCLPNTLCKWNFGFINHRFLAAGRSRTGLCCSDKNAGLLPQTRPRGARRAAWSATWAYGAEHGTTNCHPASC